ncbi:MAG: HAMP domain-containing histidine kinase [Proteobacteria bacterium]|nr:HAMP domain-containing histidine kinase [Pseudomonadota bacterium]
MNHSVAETRFLPAGRSNPKQIEDQRGSILRLPLIRLFMGGIPDGVVILNADRQILMANPSLLRARNLEDESPVIGLRPGEAFDCIHARDHAGCGTTEFCRYCGAAQVLHGCRMGRQSAKECRIVTRYAGGVESLDLLVWGTPFTYDDRSHILFVLADISHEKRRRVLERLFFHDFLNTAGGLRVFAQLLLHEGPPEARDLAEPIFEGADLLVQGIRSHKELLDAESGELTIEPVLIEPLPFLRQILGQFEKRDIAGERALRLEARTEEIGLYADSTILKRVLGNLIQNALEASSPGETVTLGFRAESGAVTFNVHNRAVMPEETRYQIFQRSYSSKGTGRGLGLYSVRLLTERYLGGRVFFTSDPENGTTFFVNLPATTEE